MIHRKAIHLIQEKHNINNTRLYQNKANAKQRAGKNNYFKFTKPKQASAKAPLARA